MVRNADLARDPAFAAACPGVAEALLSGASAQLRNAATVGGNLLQKTRCAYFQDNVSACNRRAPGTGCDARGGDNRTHAVLGWSEHCIATNPSDMCVALAALDTVVEIEGPDGTREVPLADFHLLPGDTPDRDTALKPGEIVTALRVPASATEFSAHSRYLKLRERTSFAFALVSAAATLEMDGEVIRNARLALGGVAAKPWRVRSVETLLAGAKPTRTAFEAAAAAALADATPSGENAYKIDLAKRVITRAFLMAAAGTPDRLPALPASPFATGVAAHA